jgi:hypothetical protein
VVRPTILLTLRKFAGEVLNCSEITPNWLREGDTRERLPLRGTKGCNGSIAAVVNGGYRPQPAIAPRSPKPTHVGNHQPGGVSVVQAATPTLPLVSISTSRRRATYQARRASGCFLQ